VETLHLTRATGNDRRPGHRTRPVAAARRSNAAQARTSRAP